jgi:hypothetical protein
VLLRELHRTVKDSLAAVVAVVPSDPTAPVPPGLSRNFTEAGILKEFQQAHWTPRFHPVDESEGADDSLGTVRWGVVLAE